HAGVLESFAELAVQSTPAHPLVEAVHADHVLAPDGRVVAVERRARRRDPVEYGARRGRDAEPEQGAIRLGAVPDQPATLRGEAAGHVRRCDRPARPFREFRIAAGQEAAGSHQTIVYGEEVAARNA